METKKLSINLDEIVIKSINNQSDFEYASNIIDALVDADLIENTDERRRAMDVLEAITILAIDYEKKHYSIPKPKSNNVNN